MAYIFGYLPYMILNAIDENVNHEVYYKFLASSYQNPLKILFSLAIVVNFRKKSWKARWISVANMGHGLKMFKMFQFEFCVIFKKFFGPKKWFLFLPLESKGLIEVRIYQKSSVNRSRFLKTSLKVT